MMSARKIRGESPIGARDREAHDNAKNLSPAGSRGLAAE
jgi:hypothetical protein